MILVLFEVIVKKEGMADYLSLAASLKDALQQVEGFIRAERFSSLTNAQKLLSLSFGENEEAVGKWRNLMEHRLSQKQCRERLFDSYSITIVSKVRQYIDVNPTESPQDSVDFFSTLPD